MIRRDWLLQQLGITQWTLRRPELLQRGVALTLPGHVRLLIIAETPPPLDHPLVIDVARSMALIPEQLYWLTPLQARYLSDSVRYYFWWLGLEAELDFDGISFHTPPLSVLSADAVAKRELWSRISNYEYHRTAIT
ncbi:DNA polymerase III, psi subunit [secondary endosymbiont of Ctenarytaina eucalypti]|uniref:DNA polymerase III subunit psi n=2 Tax=secondary endosymbiont of Ctenarytaina eucalypti TaxID=1199245 RepID=J3TFA5_9ENTR|nr:DNA polymerase III, psi subunit [secondary endosymbiont of Ctenarytaina eucalypti]